VHPRQSKSQFFMIFFWWAGEIGSVVVVNLAVLDYVLGRRMEKVVNFLEEKSGR